MAARLAIALLSLTLIPLTVMAQAHVGTSAGHSGAGHSSAGHSSSTSSAGSGHAAAPVQGRAPAAPSGWHQGVHSGNGFRSPGAPAVPGIIAPLPVPTIQPLPLTTQPLLGGTPPQTYRRDGYRHYRNNSVVVGVPVYVPGYSVYTLDSSGYAVPVPAYPLDPNATAVMPQQQDPQIEQTGPGVYVIGPQNQNAYQPPDPQVDPGQVQPQPASKAITLLAFKDHSIYAVTDYWKEGDRLYYVTSYGGSNNVSLDQLDQDFTKRLNSERSVPFEIKSADQN